MNVYLGARRVVIRDCGRGNSPDDVMVEVPDEHVLFTGDIVVQAPIPYLGASWPVEWAAVLRAIESDQAAVAMPGTAEGRTTRRRAPRRVQPSIRAAASSSTGTDWT